ncbi:Uncharacterized conserved protein, DUF952 family [Jatrophihabitans endophyticus]|uniref:Uncharacterized conserved protein, DUF952 family n=1 Tax=Jatrophihabitans endophyticus TaxID=1206085 RepID=A0A1M5PNJ4_9ACTN|nr:DUF952 domain-containing protein [Jatrophihabitans endophyticus]SHH03169.1 Uncharacterized conserved protein, DUF952 family [Jatrophihabitans endophyticus]
MRLFHLVTPVAWAEAVAAGSYAPSSLATEGFVHFSFADQVGGTANLLYRDVAELVVVEIDPERTGAELRVEDSYGTGTQFPHLYGPVPVAAAVAVHPIARDEAGDWTFSPGA